MPETSNVMSNISEVQFFAKLVADAVTNEVSAHLDSFYLKVFAGVLSIMASAIAYMYLTQKSERKQSDDRLFAVLGESTRLMESVTTGLKSSASQEKKTKRTLDKVSTVLLGCISRNTLLDNTLEDSNTEDEDDEEEL